MLLTIHNLPVTTRYADIKSLLQSKCGLQHVILDNLISAGATKKVTVGVAEDADAAILMGKINGLYWNGQQLYVEDVRQQKTASGQPFHPTNPQTQQSDMSFNTMSMQNSSYSTMAPNLQTAQSMMAAMYNSLNIPNQNYIQPGFGQNYMQTEKVQNEFMDTSGFIQNTPQNSQSQNHSRSETRGSGWGQDYNKQQDFASEEPQFHRQSPENHGRKWNVNQQQKEGPSCENREQPWSRGSGGCGPTQPAYRSTIRKTQPDFRSTSRPDERSRPDRPELEHNQGRPDQFSRRPNEFSGRPNEFSGRPNEFSGRPNEFSRRPKEFSGRSNEFAGRPKEFSGRQNEFSGRPNEFSGRNNEFPRRPNEREERDKDFSSRPNTFTRKGNEWQESLSERQKRPNERPGPSYEQPAFDRSNERPQCGRSDDRPMFSRHNTIESSGMAKTNANPGPPPKKPRYEAPRFANKIDRPERVSRPDSYQQPPYQPKFPPKKSGQQFVAANEPMTQKSETKFDKSLHFIGLRKIVTHIKNNLGLSELDLLTRQMFNKVITERLNNLLGDKTTVDPSECFNVYRAKYSKTSDATTYNIVLGLIAQSKGEETYKPVGKPKVEMPKLMGLKFVPKKFGPPPPKIKKSERMAQRNMKEARQLIAQGKLPTFPHGDKRLVAQHKKEEKECIIPDVEATFKAAIDVELGAVIDICNRQLSYDPNKSIQRVYDNVNKANFSDEMKRLLNQSLARRVTNSGLKVLRVYGYPKLPKREVLEKCLRRYGVLALRKSEKSRMYTTTVDTYQNYDLLCEMESIVIGETTLIFKPFHAAPKKRANQANLRATRNIILQKMIDYSDLNLLDKDWPVKEAEIKAKEAEKQAALEAEKKAREAKKQAEQARLAEKIAEEIKKNAAKTKKVKQETEKGAEVTEKQGEETEKQAEEAEKQENNEEQTEKNLSNKAEGNKSQENKKDGGECKPNDYLHADFCVIDEVNETDSDVELIHQDIKVVNVDEDEENNDAVMTNAVNDETAENNVTEVNGVEKDGGKDNDDKKKENDDEEKHDDQNMAGDFDIDNIDVDMDDINDDDLEDY